MSEEFDDCEELSMSESTIKDESVDEDDIIDASINPLENVKVEYEEEMEEDDVPAESGSALDPLANVEVEYAHAAETSQSQTKSRRSKDSGVANNSMVKFVKTKEQILVQEISSTKMGRTFAKRRRSKTKQYNCNYCPFTTGHKKAIGTHRALCYKTPIEGIKSDEGTSDQSDTTKQDNQSEDQLYICHVCHFKTRQKFSLVRHISDLHSNVKTVVCDICSFKTTCQNYLIRHMKANHNADIETIFCDDCDESFKTRQDRKMHKLYVHGYKNGKISCDLCSFICKSTLELARHKQKKHLNSIIDMINSDVLT